MSLLPSFMLYLKALKFHNSADKSELEFDTEEALLVLLCFALRKHCLKMYLIYSSKASDLEFSEETLC